MHPFLACLSMLVSILLWVVVDTMLFTISWERFGQKRDHES